MRGLAQAGRVGGRTRRPERVPSTYPSPSLLIARVSACVAHGAHIQADAAQPRAPRRLHTDVCVPPLLRCSWATLQLHAQAERPTLERQQDKPRRRAILSAPKHWPDAGRSHRHVHRFAPGGACRPRAHAVDGAPACRRAGHRRGRRLSSDGCEGRRACCPSGGGFGRPGGQSVQPQALIRIGRVEPRGTRRERKGTASDIGKAKEVNSRDAPGPRVGGGMGDQQVVWVISVSV